MTVSGIACQPASKTNVELDMFGTLHVLFFIMKSFCGDVTMDENMVVFVSLFCIFNLDAIIIEECGPKMLKVSCNSQSLSLLLVEAPESGRELG